MADTDSTFFERNVENVMIRWLWRLSLYFARGQDPSARQLVTKDHLDKKIFRRMTTREPRASLGDDGVIGTYVAHE
jgi:hypothetical protein